MAPYAPRFLLETWLLPKQHGSSFENNQSPVFSSLARALKDVLGRLDTVLDYPAYNFILHTAPIGESNQLPLAFRNHAQAHQSSRLSGARASTSAPPPKKPRASSAKPPSPPRSDSFAARAATFRSFFAILTSLRRGTQEAQGEVCKTSIRGFDPTRASNILFNLARDYLALGEAVQKT